MNERNSDKYPTVFVSSWHTGCLSTPENRFSGKLCPLGSPDHLGQCKAVHILFLGGINNTNSSIQVSVKC